MTHRTASYRTELGQNQATAARVPRWPSGTCPRRARRLYGLLLAGVLAAGGGCRLSEALVDGLYGGVSDTVAGAISAVLLSGLGGG